MSSPRIASAFGSTPFDRIDSVYSAILKDSFLATQTTTSAGAVVSEIPWLVTDEAGGAGGDVTQLASTDDHLGIVSLSVGGTSPADGDMVSMTLGTSDDNVSLAGDGVYMAAVLRVVDVDATIVEFGLVDDPNEVPNNSVANFIGYCFDPEDSDNTGDAFWFAQVNDAGTDAEEILSDVSYVESDWVLLEMVADETGGTFRITTEDNEQTVRIAGTVTATLTPCFKVENVGDAEEHIDIDTFVLRYNLPDDITNYLGA